MLTGVAGRLASLHLQRSPELTDALLASTLAALPSLSALTLTACRDVTCGGWFWFRGYFSFLTLTACRDVTCGGCVVLVLHNRNMT